MTNVCYNYLLYCTSFNLGKYSGFASLPNLTQIGSRAFYYCNFSNVVLPEKITEVGENAFWGRDAKKESKITVMGDTSGYSPLAFGGFVNVEYKKGIECELVNLRFSSTSNYSNRAGRYTVKFVWNVTSDVDGIEVEISEDSDFSTVFKGKGLAQKAEKDQVSGLVVYVSVDDVKAPATNDDIFWMNNMYVRARVFLRMWMEPKSIQGGIVINNKSGALTPIFEMGSGWLIRSSAFLGYNR